MQPSVIDDYMMQHAIVTAKFSYCKRRKVGAILANGGRIIASGMNGTLPKTDNCCENPDGTTSDFTVHAEQNIITFCAKNGIPTKGCTMYITTSPCTQCAKLIAASGITRVVFLEQYKDMSGVEFLKNIGIIVSQYPTSLA